MWKPSPKVMVFGGEAFGRGLGRSPQNWPDVFLSVPEDSLSLACEDTVRHGCPRRTREQALSGFLCHHRDLGLGASELWEEKGCTSPCLWCSVGAAAVGSGSGHSFAELRVPSTALDSGGHFHDLGTEEAGSTGHL